MEQRGTPVRKTHTSTADLLSWPEGPTFDSSPGNNNSRPVRNFLPSDGISKVVFGGQVTDEEFELLSKRKPCSENKRRETGSSIFAGEYEDNDHHGKAATATPSNKSGLRMYQQTVAGMSQISFATDESTAPKKPATLAEAAKQRELSGNLDGISEAKLKKQFSDAKYKELSGNNVFAPPPEIKPRDVQPSPAFRQTNTEPISKTTKKIHDQKLAQLSGNNIFKGDAALTSAEKPLSTAKLREISGNDIFSDGKTGSRDYYTGVRKPPGGESSISLV